MADERKVDDESVVRTLLRSLCCLLFKTLIGIWGEWGAWVEPNAVRIDALRESWEKRIPAVQSLRRC
jgi:hypothetical protein